MYCINATAMKILSQHIFVSKKWRKSIIMRILILPYTVDYDCPCIWTVYVIQSCILIAVSCTLNQGMSYMYTMYYTDLHW